MDPHQSISSQDLTPAPFPSAWEDKEPGTHPEDGIALQFSIFEGKDFLRNEHFFKEKVVVGKSEEADLILNGRNIADIHAFFYLNGDQIFVSDGDLGSGVMVNGRFVTSRALGPLDSVTIGPFTLKIKLDKVVVSPIPQSDPLPAQRRTEVEDHADEPDDAKKKVVVGKSDEPEEWDEWDEWDEPDEWNEEDEPNKPDELKVESDHEENLGAVLKEILDLGSALEALEAQSSTDAQFSSADELPGQEDGENPFEGVSLEGSSPGGFSLEPGTDGNHAVMSYHEESEEFSGAEEEFEEFCIPAFLPMVEDQVEDRDEDQDTEMEDQTPEIIPEMGKFEIPETKMQAGARLEAESGILATEEGMVEPGATTQSQGNEPDAEETTPENHETAPENQEDQKMVLRRIIDLLSGSSPADTSSFPISQEETDQIPARAENAPASTSMAADEGRVDEENGPKEQYPDHCPDRYSAKMQGESDPEGAFQKSRDQIQAFSSDDAFQDSDDQDQAISPDEAFQDSEDRGLGISPVRALEAATETATKTAAEVAADELCPGIKNYAPSPEPIETTEDHIPSPETASASESDISAIREDRENDPRDLLYENALNTDLPNHEASSPPHPALSPHRGKGIGRGGLLGQLAAYLWRPVLRDLLHRDLLHTSTKGIDKLKDKDTEWERVERETHDRLPEILAMPDKIFPMPDNGEEDREENEDEEALFHASFSLKENLVPIQQEDAFLNPVEMVLEVLKCRGDDAVDMCFLNGKEKYYSLNEFGRFCLAENKDRGTFHFFFTDQFKGRIQFIDNCCIDLEKLCLIEDIYRKRERVYRCVLPANAIVSFHDGSYDYYLRLAKPDQSPQVPESIQEERQFAKNLVKSVVFHILIIILAGLFLSFYNLHP